MDGANITKSATAPTEQVAFAATQSHYMVQRHQVAQSLPLLQPLPTGLEYYCAENQACTPADHPQNCLYFSAVSYPYAAAATTSTTTTSTTGDKCDESYVYYQLMNNVRSYNWYIPKMSQQPQPTIFAQKASASSSSSHRQRLTQAQRLQHLQFLGEWSPTCTKMMSGDGEPTGLDAPSLDKESAVLCDGASGATAATMLQTKLSRKMHPVQLLHQIFRKEAFVMEYERINDGPFSRVCVTYKVNGRAYMAEATRLKEARRLCAKQVLRDQFPYLRIDPDDDDIPCAEYDEAHFDNKHPVQILYQIFRYEPMEMHCEEEGAAHFAKHIFTFVIRGVRYQAKAETIKEAKRRAAILALNEYFKRSKAHSLSTTAPDGAAAPVPSAMDSQSSFVDSATNIMAAQVASATDKIGAS